ncbi:Hypothetical predicted protein [Cloeon dipterum]|uniref:Uncharacterized protein n=1 Tax=Cloeon dipterum TaxID=197152 RepID=A0A8S1BPB6_9INSE|nr:Hypothetical predicted protein [Cloeon dipterum]
MRLPTTFFFILDSHQATVAVAIFYLLWQVAIGVIIEFGYSVERTLELTSDKDHPLPNFSQLEIDAIYAVYSVEFMKLLFTFLLLFAVWKKMRWCMLPWLVATAVEFVLDLFICFDMLRHIITLAINPLFAVVVWLTFHAVIIGSELYSFLVVYCSFNDIGKTINLATTEGDESAVPFQALRDDSAFSIRDV